MGYFTDTVRRRRMRRGLRLLLLLTCLLSLMLRAFLLPYHNFNHCHRYHHHYYSYHHHSILGQDSALLSYTFDEPHMAVNLDNFTPYR